jgi:Na+-translocating ferredoxin:NAD+ oxidoreductase RnfG subunit
MDAWLRWTLPVAAVVATAAPVQAARYLTLEQAQRLAFPEASAFREANVIYRPEDVAAIERLSGVRVRSRGEQVWRAETADGRLVGFFMLDYVIGKHLVIDYAVALTADGRVRRVEVLEYRESYGGEVAERGWLVQFEGRSLREPLQVDKDIRNISGATLSSHHVTEGVRRVLAIYETRLRHG